MRKKKVCYLVILIHWMETWYLKQKFSGGNQNLFTSSRLLYLSVGLFLSLKTLIQMFGVEQTLCPLSNVKCSFCLFRWKYSKYCRVFVSPNWCSNCLLPWRQSCHFRLKAVLCLKDVSAGVLRKVSDDTNVFLLKQSVGRCLWCRLCSPRLLRVAEWNSSNYLQFVKNGEIRWYTEEKNILNSVLLQRRRRRQMRKRLWSVGSSGEELYPPPNSKFFRVSLKSVCDGSYRWGSFFFSSAHCPFKAFHRRPAGFSPWPKQVECSFHLHGNDRVLSPAETTSLTLQVSTRARLSNDTFLCLSYVLSVLRETLVLRV